MAATGLAVIGSATDWPQRKRLVQPVPWSPVAPGIGRRLQGWEETAFTAFTLHAATACCIANPRNRPPKSLGACLDGGWNTVWHLKKYGRVDAPNVKGTCWFKDPGAG